MADFDTRQLDQLEDALESLEDFDDLASLELSPALTERLAEYQDVLALCRDAYPMEAPPDDLLSEVIAEAHEVSRRPKLRDGQDDTSSGGWARFWERWRGTLVPGLALAGTAAAVLWLLGPEQELERSHDLLADSTIDDEPRPVPDTERSQPASEPSEPSDPIKLDDDQAAPEPAMDPESSAGAGEAVQDPLPSKKQSKKSKSGDSEMALEPAPAPEPMSKDDTWKILDRANAARLTGDCDRARATYEDIIAASSDSLAIARAKAGIGLCFEQSRQDSQAASWYDDARSANPGIDAWINTQRDEQPMPGESKKKAKAAPKKKSSKKSAPLDADSL